MNYSCGDAFEEKKFLGKELFFSKLSLPLFVFLKIIYNFHLQQFFKNVFVLKDSR